MQKLFAGLTAILLIATCTAAISDQQSMSAIRTTGIVEPLRTVTIASAIMGRIETLPFEEGDKVSADEVMVTINADELKADLASARVERELAVVEAQYHRKLEARMQKLGKAKSIGQDKLDEAVFKHAAAKAKVQIADANIAKIQAALRETEIKAPFTGIVTRREAEIGQITQPGEPLLVLEDHATLRLRTSVKERDLASVVVNAPALIVFDALGGKQLEGSVEKIIPSGDPKNHTFTIDIALPPNEGLLPGMYGKIEIVRTEAGN